MDYTNQPLAFRLRKGLRYVRLYGPSRTAVKVRSQYHMQRSFSPPPAERSGDPRQHVGILGCGKFAYAQVAYYLTRGYGRVLRGAMDVDVNRAASLFDRYGLAYYTDDAKRLIHDPAIDLVYIASNHASHAEYAIEALEAGKHVHIEKPHVVSEDQLRRLCEAMGRCRGQVTLGFNRPLSPFGREIRRRLDAEQGPAMLNWFIAGHEIPADHWYFREEEGGRVLGNLCHWTDFVYRMVSPADRYPIVIRPTRAEKSDCDIAVTYTFGDGTIAAITFSAKGHTFEGVKERFAAHRGNLLLTMDDFQTMTVEVAEHKHRKRLRTRDHGHEASIRRSYELALRSTVAPGGCSPRYVWETGDLFLKTREALEQERVITLASYHDLAVERGAAST